MNESEKGKKVTIYTTSEFMGNVVKYEGTLVDYGVRKYAQYDAAPFVDFIPKGKRKTVRIQKSYKSYLLILLGTGYPEPQPLCPPEGGMSKYASHDEGWKRDFNTVLSKWESIKPLAILADYRTN